MRKIYELMIQKYPHMFQGLSYLKCLLSIDSIDWTEIQHLVQSNEDLTGTIIDRYGFLLHYACAKNAPADFVIQLIEKYPEAVSKRDYNGKNPLELARQFNQSASVIQLLLEKTPIMVDDGLDLVLLHSPDWGKIRILIQLNKELIKKQIDNNREYLLHYACRKFAPTELIIELINEYPEAVRIKGCCKEYPYPLHLACCYQRSKQVIELLIKM
jgi:ankyrin repeat protein